MDSVYQDVRFALRALLRRPGFLIVAVASLALGIGANTAIFSLVDQIMLRKLPVARPEELVLVKSPGERSGHTSSDEPNAASSFSYSLYKELRARNEVFTGMLARYGFIASISFNGQSDRTPGELVSGNYFEVLGTAPFIGRFFDDRDDVTIGGHPVAVLSYGFWSRQFGRDVSMINREILLNGRKMTVVGVTRPGFFGVQLGYEPSVFVPITMKPLMTPNWNGLDRADDYWLNIVARLKPGVTREKAAASLAPIYRSLLETEADRANLSGDHRKAFIEKPLLIHDGSAGRQILQRDASDQLRVLMALVSLVLLVACANIANLLIARTAARRREIAIRLAIGASRLRLVRQLMVESLSLALAGGFAGLLVASWTLRALLQMIPPATGNDGISGALDYRLLLFNFALAGLCGVIFGLLPAWRATRFAPVASLKEESGTTMDAGQVWLRKTLVVAQVAMTVVSLAGAGLFMKALLRLEGIDVGMRVDHVLRLTVAPSAIGYTPERSRSFYGELRASLAALPGVSSVSMAEVPVFRDTDRGSDITIDGYQPANDERIHAYRNEIGSQYFAVLGVPLRAGREFTDSDSSDSPKVCMINEALADKFFQKRDPVGSRISFGFGNRKREMEIVGVVKNSKHGNAMEDARIFVYTPYTQEANIDQMTYYLRSKTDPSTLMPSARRSVQLLDPTLPVSLIMPLEDQVVGSMYVERLMNRLTSAFGVLATLLAALGIYGVMSYLVTRRTREIGIRMALGAEASSVRWIVLREVLAMMAAGVWLGVPLALALGKVVDAMIRPYGLRGYDPAVLAASMIVVVAMTALSGYLPARRATRINPLIALRHE